MIKGVVYSDVSMKRSAVECAASLSRAGATVVWQNNPDTISNEFRHANRGIMTQRRGAGYWLWKPYLIDQAVDHPSTNDGDYIVYSDAGVLWIDKIEHLINAMDQDIFLFSNGHKHVHWCKADVMHGINGGIVANDIEQVQASVIIVKVTPFSRRFIREWLLWCQMPGFIDDSPSMHTNHPEFAEHRHDQAILSCLAIKYGIRLHWWADKLWYLSQRHRWPKDTYPPMFEHHRRRDKGYGENKNPEWI